jgi:hypothetical protein
VYEQDLRNIQDGLYKAPYDMNVTHRQYNPLFVLVRGLSCLLCIAQSRACVYLPFFSDAPTLSFLSVIC